MIQTLSFIITYETNFLIDCQYVFGFYKDSRHKRQQVCKRNVFKSDFTSILPTARLGSNFSTSLANENESFIVY